MNPADLNSSVWQGAFFLAAAVLVLVQTWRGWRLGLVRQFTEIVALLSGYASAWLGGPYLGFLFRPLGFPDALLAVLAGAVFGLVVYVAITIFSGVLFKRTEHQSWAIVRFGYGTGGAVLGAGTGLVLAFMAMLGVRVLGTLAEAQVQQAARAAANSTRAVVRPPASPFYGAQNLAGMKHALDQGAAGAMFRQVDPVPEKLYSILTKLGLMTGNEQSVERFLQFPGVQPIAEHPKILALRDDPAIVEHVLARDFLALVRDPLIVQAANDGELRDLLSKLDFERALDYAVGGK